MFKEENVRIPGKDFDMGQVWEHGVLCIRIADGQDVVLEGDDGLHGLVEWVGELIGKKCVTFKFF